MWAHRTPPTSPDRPELPGHNAPTRMLALRAYAIVALIVLAMAGALLVAKHILLSDWSDKTRAARAAAAERAEQARLAAASLAAHAAADAAVDDAESLRRLAGASWLYVEGKVNGGRVLHTLETFETALHLPPGAIWRAQADTLLMQGNRPLARKALRLSGTSTRTCNAWALYDMETANYASAIQRLRGVLRHHPGSASALYNLALCYIYTRRSAEAQACLAAYLGQRPDDEAALRLQAALLVQAGQGALALDLLETYIRQAAKPTPILLDAAYLEAKAGHDAMAIRLLEAAIPAVPLARLIQVYNTQDFQRAKLTPAGQELTARLAALARSAAASPVFDDLLLPARPLRGAKRQ